jgi:AraC-like DNA-binding protein
MAEKKKNALRSAIQPQAMRAFQRKFLERIAPESHFHVALNYLDNTQVVVKDAAGRFVWLSDNVARRYGFAEGADMVGSDVFATNPPRLAKMYHCDDLEVLRSGRPLLGKIELVFDPRGMLNWHVTNKVPLQDRRGKVIGLIVLIQEYPGQQDLPVAGDLRAMVAYIFAHLAEPLRTSHLATVAGVSSRQVERRFRDAAGMSPTEFILRARVGEACRWLRDTDEPIVKIAAHVGFYDQSALSRCFRKYLGMPPREFRKARAHA